MKIKLAILLVVVAVVGAALIYVLNSLDSAVPAVDQSANQSTDTSSKPADSTTQPPETKVDVDADDTQAVKGSYVDYSTDKVASTTGTKVLFFHAPWCPQCRALENDIKAVQLPDNVTIFKVDYDTNQTLRQKYGVTIQTTLVTIDGNGDLIKKYVAYDEPTFASVKTNLLDK